jgi:peptide/nickel transport system permease protein
MLRFVLRRFLYSILAIIVATMLVFALSRVQGDPRYLYLTGYATKEMFDAWGKEYGLDKPLVVQYGIWLGNAVRGDFGQSLRAGRSAFGVIIERIPATLQLALAAWLFALLTGIPLGVLSAVKRGSLWDYLGRSFALLGQALPPFWTGIMLILFFAVRLEWFPVGTRGGIRHYILPAITLGWLAAAGNLRLVRSAMLDVLDSEYVKYARSKGVSEMSIVWKHAMRNSIIPPLTFAGITLASFLAGTVVTETVFAWPGIGRLAVDAVIQNDYPVMTGIVLILTLMYVLIMMLIDILYAYADPRIRF